MAVDVNDVTKTEVVQKERWIPFVYKYSLDDDEFLLIAVFLQVDRSESISSGSAR